MLDVFTRVRVCDSVASLTQVELVARRAILQTVPLVVFLIAVVIVFTIQVCESFQAEHF